MNSGQWVGEVAGRGGTLSGKFTLWAARESHLGTLRNSAGRPRQSFLTGRAAPSTRSADSSPAGPHRRATWSLHHIFFFGCFVLYVVVQSLSCV